MGNVKTGYLVLAVALVAATPCPNCRNTDPFCPIDNDCCFAEEQLLVLQICHWMVAMSLVHSFGCDDTVARPLIGESIRGGYRL